MGKRVIWRKRLGEMRDLRALTKSDEIALKADTSVHAVVCVVPLGQCQGIGLKIRCGISSLG
jgi:hypothetical protein